MMMLLVILMLMLMMVVMVLVMLEGKASESHISASVCVQEPAKAVVPQSTAPPMAEMLAPGRPPLDKLMDALKHADPTLLPDAATATRVALLRAQGDHKVDVLPPQGLRGPCRGRRQPERLESEHHDDQRRR